jgi:predicted phage terminase large subunit-like protein
MASRTRLEVNLPPDVDISNRVLIGPQPGPQTAFLSCGAQITVYGGAAGGGKSYGLLLDAGRYACFDPVRGFGATIFRRTMTQVTQQGGLWETSLGLYPLTEGAKPRQTPWLGWEWPQHGTAVRFAHLQHEIDKQSYQGAQMAYLGFDELTHFTASQFWYMVSRNRSTSGVPPRIAATLNPDPDSWVKAFLGPWVDEAWPESEQAESGEIRWFYRDGDAICWLHKPSQRPKWIERDEVYSVTFIEAKLADNPRLLEKDPGYRGRIRAMPLYERTIMEGGKKAWSIRKEGNVFRAGWFKVVDAVPADECAWVRFWDFAATSMSEEKAQDPDYTVGTLVGLTEDGRYYVRDMVELRGTPAEVEQLVINTAAGDGPDISQVCEQEPGSAGKSVAHHFVTMLDGYDAHAVPATGDKATRARPVSAQAEVGNVYVMRAPWLERWRSFLCAFPNPRVHDDHVDSLSGGCAWLRDNPRPRIRWFGAGRQNSAPVTGRRW